MYNELQDNASIISQSGSTTSGEINSRLFNTTSNSINDSSIEVSYGEMIILYLPVHI